MIKHFYKSSFIFALSILFIGCSDDKKVFDVDGGLAAFQFVNQSADFGVTDESTVYQVEVGITTRSAVERGFTVEVDEENTTAVNGSFSIPNEILFMPSNSFTTTFGLTIVPDLLPISGTVTVSLILIPQGGVELIRGKEKISVVLRLCPIEQTLSGLHTYSSTNLVRGGGQPACVSTPTGTVTWSDTATPNVYTTTDMAFGMYQNCWSVPAGAISASSGVQWDGNNIIALGTDQYGDTFQYNIISVNGPELVIDWTNSYGDAGKVTITKACGTNWPAELQTED